MTLLVDVPQAALDAWRQALAASREPLVASPHRPLLGLDGFDDDDRPPPASLLAPKLGHVDAATLVTLRHDLLTGADPERTDAWAVRLTRALELRRRSWWRVLGGRFDDPRAGLLHLAVFLLDWALRSGDWRPVNAVLKTVEQRALAPLQALARPPRGDLTTGALALHVQLLLTRARAAIADRPTQPPAPFAERPRADDPVSGRVVVFSPSPYSLLTIGVTESLRRRGIDVAAVAVRRLVNWRRLIVEWRRDGMRLPRKVWNKLFLRRKAYRPETFETMADWLASQQIGWGSVDALCAERDIRLVRCRTLNDAPVLALLDEVQPDAVVFTGGGLIRQPTLDRAGAGVLNCHMGVLPRFRGMDVVEWPLLEGRLDALGMTVHLMDAGVDTGAILHVERVPLSPGWTIRQLRGSYEPRMARALVDTAADLLAGRATPTPQAERDGQQYFIMHPALQALAEARLADFQDSPA